MGDQKLFIDVAPQFPMTFDNMNHEMVNMNWTLVLNVAVQSFNYNQVN